MSWCAGKTKSQCGSNRVVTLSVKEFEGDDELLDISYFKIVDLS